MNHHYRDDSNRQSEFRLDVVYIDQAVENKEADEKIHLDAEKNEKDLHITYKLANLLRLCCLDSQDYPAQTNEKKGVQNVPDTQHTVSTSPNSH